MNIESEDVVSVRTFLVYGGYVSVIVTCIFSCLLVTMSPGPEENGYMRYISEGMEEHCGWSVLVLGTCALFTLMCQVVASLHMNKRWIVIFVFMSGLGWNTVLAVRDTGWSIHYVGLSMALLGNLTFHWYSSRDEYYGGFQYMVVNIVAIVISLLFICLAAASSFNSSIYELRAASVSVEFILVFAICIENLHIIHGLDQYDSIHLIFHSRKNVL